jgi:predicted porin
MNKSLFVAAIAVLAAGTAAAQSSVTVYGRFNASAESLNRDGKKTKELVNSASRIGFKGSEDLGGGLKAGFQLEHGFNVDNGAQSQSAFWARQSEVNLSGGFGKLRAGNFTSEAYYATADYISMHNHDTGTSSDAFYAYVGRNRNKIAYRTPELVKGFTVEAAVSAGEGERAGTQIARRNYDVAANYNAGPLQLGLGYEKADTATTKINQFAGRVLYEMGPLVLGAYYQRDENAYGPGKRNTYRGSMAYSMGPSEVHLNIGKAGSYSRLSDSDATQWTVAYNYNLSKRTKVYTFYTKVDDSARKVYGGDFSSLALGIRHNF